MSNQNHIMPLSSFSLKVIDGGSGSGSVGELTGNGLFRYQDLARSAYLKVSGKKNSEGC